MINRAATRFAAHEETAVGLQPFNIAFGKGVLVVAYHHGAAVLPQIHHHFVVVRLRQQIVFNGNVQVGVGLGADNNTWHSRILIGRDVASDKACKRTLLF